MAAPQRDTILIVEDNTSVRQELELFLNRQGFCVNTITRFDNVAGDSLTAAADLIILDLNLPEESGFAVCREIRLKSKVPILVVTSREADIDQVLAMELGADDYVTKPYNTDILLARIKAVLRRSRPLSSELQDFGTYQLLPAEQAIQIGNQRYPLSRNEWLIFVSLQENLGCIVSRDQLMRRLWNSNEFIEENTLSVNVNRLRQHLSEIHLNLVILTHRAVGYRLVEKDDAADSTSNFSENDDKRSTESDEKRPQA
jgi:DNA-binding response OmpR family regulator